MWKEYCFVNASIERRSKMSFFHLNIWTVRACLSDTEFSRKLVCNTFSTQRDWENVGGEKKELFIIQHFPNYVRKETDIVDAERCLNCNFIKVNLFTWTSQHNVEIQTVNTDWWIVFDTQINMFLNTKAEISASWEVVTSQFVFTDLYKHRRKENQLVNGIGHVI